MNKVKCKCDWCGKDISVPFLTMTGKNQENKHYCENCIEQVCGVTAYTFYYFNKENLIKSLEVNNVPNPYWKGCEGCNEKSRD